MNDKEHLPVIGVGPIIVIPQLILTAAGLILSAFSLMPKVEWGYSKSLAVSWGMCSVLSMTKIKKNRGGLDYEGGYIFKNR